MAENKQNTTPERRPDCVTEIRMGNTVLVVSGFFKKDTTDTAADKMKPTQSRTAFPICAGTRTMAILVRTSKDRAFNPCLRTLKPGKWLPLS